MKKILLLAITLAVPAILIAQINVQWESRYTTSGSNPDRVHDMVIDASGNVYVTGSGVTGGTSYDIITVKYDNSGTELWNRSYNGSSNGLDEGFAIEVDGSGNVYVLGYATEGSGDADIVTLKYNSAGTFQWDALYDRAGLYDVGRDIGVDASGNVYVCGEAVQNSTNTDYVTIKYNSGGTQQWAMLKSGAGSLLDQPFTLAMDGTNVIVAGQSFVSGANSNFMTVKYNTSGTELWTRTYDASGAIDSPTDIIADGSGNVYVTGQSFGGLAEDFDYATIKYNSGGTQQWVARYNGSESDFDKPNALVVDGSGNVIVTGRSLGTGTGEDYATIMYNSSGTQMWVKRYNGSGANQFDEATDIALDAAGDIYVVGASNEGTGNSNDYTTIKYDISGNRIWVARFNGPASNADDAKAMAIDPTGNIYVSGTSKGSSTNLDYSTIKYCQLLTDAGADVNICIGDTANLVITGGASAVSWTPTGTLSNPTGYSTEAYPTSTTTYIVYTENASGCRDYDTITVTVNPLPGPGITPSGPTTFCMGDSVTLVADPFDAYQWSTGVNDTLQSITVYSTGTYTVTVIDSMGCNNSTNQAVTANALPTADAGVNQALCMGDSVQLNATGGIDFAWDMNTQLSDTSIANPWVIPTDTAWYYVTVTDGNGCMDWDSVQVLTNPLPAAPSISQIGYDLVSTTACTSTDYQWYFNGIPISGANSQLYDALLMGNGDYMVEITDCNGCNALSDTLSIIDIGTHDIREFAGMLIYPNPNEGNFQIELSYSKSDMATLNIVGVAGNLIYSETLQGIRGETRHQLSLDLAPGAYTVQLISELGSVNRNVIIR